MPAVSCAAGADRWSAVRVGIGDFTDDAPALEQVGTEADCDTAGRAHYGSWYELVPDVSHDLRLTVRPGDRVAASVTVLGRRVRLRLSNRTTGRSATRLLRARVLDQTSAEWIVEAPSACGDTEGANCRIMPLADFGAARIDEARATSTAGRSGGIGHAAWDATRIDLMGHGLGARTGEPDAGGQVFSVATAQGGRGTP